MAQTILLKRGLEASRLAYTPLSGELLYVTDTGILYIGDGVTAGGIITTSATDLNILNNYIPNTALAAANGVATLGADSKIPTDQLPALAITSTFTAATEIEQLAVTAQEGDVVVRTDLNKSYIHNGGTAGTMADYQELLTPTDTVLSVNGATGAVTLTTDDVTEGVTNLYYTDDRVAALMSTQTTDDLTEGATNLYYTDARADANRAAASIDGLGDVDTTTVIPSTEDFLKFDGTNWIPSSPQTLSIDDLSDVDTTSVAPVTGEVLKYDGTGWTPGPDVSSVVSLNDIGDVNVAAVTDGQIISWDTTASEWQATSLPTGADGTFIGLTDTPLDYTGAGGQVLRVNAGATAVEFDSLTTTDIAEGTNLYYTEVRATANFTTNIALADTDDLAEGATNLYFTTARADAQIALADLGDLANVTAGGTDGQVLTIDASGNWAAATIDGGAF